MADDYIKRSDAINAYKNSRSKDNHRTVEGSLVHKQEHNHIIHILDMLSAADVIEVIRCSECQHWGGVVFGNVCKRWSAPLAGMKNCTQPDDFCSYGKRKGDENAENI